MVELFRKLDEQLKSYNGRLMYGYLPKSIKETVNNIVAEIAKDKNLEYLYLKWNEINREKLSLYYDKERPDIPLEDNKEFRSIKNYILKSISLLSKATPTMEIDKSSVEQSVSGIVFTLAKLIANSCKRKRAKLFGQVDSKLKSKLEEKKVAHGLKSTEQLIRMKSKMTRSRDLQCQCNPSVEPYVARVAILLHSAGK